MADNMSKAKELKEKLFYEKKNCALIMNDEQLEKAYEFCDGYMTFLSAAKTERLAVRESVALAKKAGFVAFEQGKQYKSGDKVYYVNREKSIILATIGEKPISEGIHLCVAHIDSPRLDLKQCPVYEDTDLALFKTHYYGGIKKYQWTAMPLALHGVIVKANGEKIDISIGENEDEPVFCVTDLLPHLAQEQMKRTLADGIKGEELNILIGSRPFKDDTESEKVKLNILNILNEKYGIIEADFLSAELEAVPAGKARDVGFDRSLIGSYGHDDRVCAYPALIAALECDNPGKTAVTILTDKEETGSDGNTGLSSAYLQYFIADLAQPYGVEARTVLSNSECLSADVNSAYDPTFPDAYEKRNSSLVNYGVVVTKFTGARGKSGTSDANAEYVGRIRRLLDENEVIWQTAELGKVDIGGGGTVAAYVANMNVDTIDVGVAVLSMHAPFEIVGKTDVYMAYKAFKCFVDEK